MFCIFCEKFENLKWPPFLVGQKFLKTFFVKIEYDPHFGGGENFWKIGESSLFKYLVGQKNVKTLAATEKRIQGNKA